MAIAIGLFLIGLFLSAFFSGSETGFYRVTRVRLVLDALGGDWISRGLLYFTNTPSLFVATALIGNNIANYVTSLGIMLATQVLGAGVVLDTVTLLVLSPLVFVYGELLPKALFFQAPNRLLRLGGPLFFAFAVLFIPISIVLWALAAILQTLIGQTPLRIRLALARRELSNLLQEGEYVGIMRPTQRTLAEGLLEFGKKEVGAFAKPISRMPIIRIGALKQDVFRMARRQRIHVIPISDDNRSLVGYVRIVDLQLDDSTDRVESYRELPKLRADVPLIAALVRLQSSEEDMACTVSEDGSIEGLIFRDELVNPLFVGQ